MWAKKEDLILRLGEKEIDKITTREVYDEETDTYVGDVSKKSRDKVLDTFLEDAKAWMLWHLAQCYELTQKEISDLFDSGEEFRVILIHHIKLTTAMLKYGGDCDECDKCKEDFSNLCNMTDICSESGVCIKRTSRYAVSDIKSCLPKDLCCGCHEEVCCCEH